MLIAFLRGAEVSWVSNIVIYQGCCLTVARSPEAPKLRAWATKFRYKEPTRAPNLSYLTHGISPNFLVNYIPLAGL